MFDYPLSIFPAIFVAILVGLIAGYLGSYVRYLTMHRVQLDHEYRLNDFEGRLNREVKVRAQQQSMKARDLDREVLALAAQQEPAPKENGLSLEDWRKKAFLRK